VGSCRQLRQHQLAEFVTNSDRCALRTVASVIRDDRNVFGQRLHARRDSQRAVRLGVIMLETPSTTGASVSVRLQPLPSELSDALHATAAETWSHIECSPTVRDFRPARSCHSPAFADPHVQMGALIPCTFAES
jgi:hypothetical protein